MKLMSACPESDLSWTLPLYPKLTACIEEMPTNPLAVPLYISNFFFYKLLDCRKQKSKWLETGCSSTHLLNHGIFKDIMLVDLKFKSCGSSFVYWIYEISSEQELHAAVHCFSNSMTTSGCCWCFVPWEFFSTLKWPHIDQRKCRALNGILLSFFRVTGLHLCMIILCLCVRCK